MATFGVIVNLSHTENWKAIVDILSAGPRLILAVVVKHLSANLATTLDNAHHDCVMAFCALAKYLSSLMLLKYQGLLTFGRAIARHEI